MLELARRRLGGDADLQVADLGDPLPYPDDAFDDAIASLVLHYFEDWTAPLAELRRVLKPSGRLIASVNHPITGHPVVRPGVDYWATYEWSEEITTASGQSYVLANWHRPLPAMIEAFTGPASVSPRSASRPPHLTPHANCSLTSFRTSPRSRLPVLHVLRPASRLAIADLPSAVVTSGAGANCGAEGLNYR